MKKHLPAFVMGVAVSTVVAWLMWPAGMDPDIANVRSPLHAPAEASAPASPTSPASPATTGGREAVASPPRDSAPSEQSPGMPANAAPPPTLELPGGGLNAKRSGDSGPLDKLLSSMKVRCTFDRGAGGYWPSGKLFPHTAAWQGGPIEFESIDILDNRARLIGNPGVTGTTDGVAEIRVTATNSGLHFSGFKPDGELFATTVFGALDSDGRYLAVMSTHGTGLDHESAQFYGGCTF